jgi:histone H3/H4
MGKAITMGKKGGKQVYTNSDSEESDDEVVYGSTNNSPVMTNIQQSNAPVTSNIVSQTSSPNISVGVPTQNNSIVSTASVHIPTTILPSNIPIKGEKNAIHGHLKGKAPNTLFLTSAGLRRYIKAAEILRAEADIHKYVNEILHIILKHANAYADHGRRVRC